ncbi:nuclear transport factor 2 family protein [Aliikangiella coralliicola]|uniref:nuclear transport factor 2 family protein n=1 Tax=Aliikangiella coralliicola TaxID=2592383 RepID=UPI00143CC55A|nr:nuclear transport factor 2 family protein [Aliikangiella coralliicola]
MILEKFKSTYQQLNSTNIDSIGELYANEIIFTDPFHRVEGLPELKQYFANQYQNIDTVEFSFGEAIYQGARFFVEWEMNLKHPRLNGNQPFCVPGCTLFRVNQDNQIIFHRDYFDAGTLLYERLPIIGGLVNWVKRKF